jgi:ribosomal protein L27
VPEALYAITVAHQASALVLKSSQVRSPFVSLGDVLIDHTDQYVIPGNIIVRQRGTQFHPGQHVRHSPTTLH